MSGPSSEPTTVLVNTTPAPTAPPIRFFDLLLALPALVVGIGLVVVLIRESRRIDLINAYVIDGGARMKPDANGKLALPSALIDFRRLVKLAPDRKDFRLGLALVYAQLGDLNRAEAIARTLAPLDEPGFLPADYWLGNRLATDPRGSTTRLKEAESHLLRVLNAPADDALARTMREPVRLLLGNVYSQTGRLKEARPLLEDVADEQQKRGITQPSLLISLAAVCRGLGDAAEAKRRTSQAAEILTKRLADVPGDASSRALLAKAYVNEDDFTGALKVIKDGEQVQDPEMVRRNTAAVCTVWADRLARANAKSAQIIEVLERGLEARPDEPALLARLADMLGSAGPAYDRIRKRFDAMISDNRSLGLVHFALGNEAWSRGQSAEAQAHWEKALNEKETELRLQPPETGVNRTPLDSRNLIALGLVKGVLQIRIFNTRGKVVVDADESRLPKQADAIAAFKKRLESLWPPHTLTASEKNEIINTAADIVGYTLEKPYSALAANNLSFALAYSETPDLTRALDLIDQALTLEPASPVFHGTRGQILVKLKRYQDALPELEGAVDRGQESSTVEAALSDAYAKLGMLNKANELREKLNARARQGHEKGPALARPSGPEIRP